MLMGEGESWGNGGAEPGQIISCPIFGLDGTFQAHLVPDVYWFVEDATWF